MLQRHPFIVSTFNEHPSAKTLLSKAFKVVKQVSKSGKTTEVLIAYLVVKRLLDEDALKTILLHHRMFMLQAVEWAALADVIDLLSQFACSLH